MEPKSGLISALFHSNECVRTVTAFPYVQSADLGELIASEFLHSFYHSYHTSVNFSRAITNKGQFASFSSKIVDAMKKLSHTILANCMLVATPNLLSALSTKSISASLLVFDDGSEPVVKGSLDDDISVIANFKAFLMASTQISMPAFL
jgi:hypothetical protein